MHFQDAGHEPHIPVGRRAGGVPVASPVTRRASRDPVAPPAEPPVEPPVAGITHASVDVDPLTQEAV